MRCGSLRRRYVDTTRESRRDEERPPPVEFDASVSRSAHGALVLSCDQGRVVSQSRLWTAKLKLGRTNLQAVHVLDVILEQVVDEPVLLDHRQALERFVLDRDGIERSTAACFPQHGAANGVAADGQRFKKSGVAEREERGDAPETSCTSTLAPCSFSSNLAFSACSPSVGLGASRRSVEDENARANDERANCGAAATGAVRKAQVACRDARSRLKEYMVVCARSEGRAIGKGGSSARPGFGYSPSPLS